MADEKEGITLKAVVGGILRALREAKHSGDVESARLVEIYRKEKSLAAFSVPAFGISDVDIELRFSIVGLPKEQGTTQDLKVNVSADDLRGLEVHQISIMKLKISPLGLRVFEEEESPKQ